MAKKQQQTDWLTALGLAGVAMFIGWTLIQRSKAKQEREGREQVVQLHTGGCSACQASGYMY